MEKTKVKRPRTLRIRFYLIFILAILGGTNIYITQMLNAKAEEYENLKNNYKATEELGRILDARGDRLIRPVNVREVLIGTPMEEAIPYIEKASEYYEIPIETFIGIANAESSLRSFECYNPWGIDTGKGNDPRCYDSWEHACNGFAHLMRYYYFNEGKDTPEEIWIKYVGWANEDWVPNVRMYWDA